MSLFSGETLLEVFPPPSRTAKSRSPGGQALHTSLVLRSRAFPLCPCSSRWWGERELSVARLHPELRPLSRLTRSPVSVLLIGESRSLPCSAFRCTRRVVPLRSSATRLFGFIPRPERGRWDCVVFSGWLFRGVLGGGVYLCAPVFLARGQQRGACSRWCRKIQTNSLALCLEICTASHKHSHTPERRINKGLKHLVKLIIHCLSVQRSTHSPKKTGADNLSSISIIDRADVCLMGYTTQRIGLHLLFWPLFNALSIGLKAPEISMNIPLL